MSADPKEHVFQTDGEMNKTMTRDELIPAVTMGCTEKGVPLGAAEGAARGWLSGSSRQEGRGVSGPGAARL